MAVISEESEQGTVIESTFIVEQYRYNSARYSVWIPITHALISYSDALSHIRAMTMPGSMEYFRIESMIKTEDGIKIYHDYYI